MPWQKRSTGNDYTMTKKILLIDDDKKTSDLVEQYLVKEGYMVYSAQDGPSGLKAAQVYKPDMIVLDVMLPRFDGIELLSKLRLKSDVYVIMLTARTEETDKIIGLSIGADDYMIKPFSPRELVARIKAAFRRMQSIQEKSESDIYAFQQLKIDVGSHQIWVNDTNIELTSLEFDLLKTLAEYRGMVLTRNQLLQKVWEFDYFGDTRVVDVHIGNLRKKLGKNHGITTVRGVGYRFDVKDI